MATQAVGLLALWRLMRSGERREPYADPHYHRLHSTWISFGSGEFEGLVLKRTILMGVAVQAQVNMFVALFAQTRFI